MTIRTQEEEDTALARKMEEEEEGRVRPATRQQTVKDWGPGKILGSSGPSESDSIPTSSFFGLARSYKPRSRQIKESDLSVFDFKFIDDSESVKIQDLKKKDGRKMGVKRQMQNQFMDDFDFSD